MPSLSLSRKANLGDWSGVGLCGIALAKAGAAEVLLTDQQCCLDLMRKILRKISCLPAQAQAQALAPSDQS